MMDRRWLINAALFVVIGVALGSVGAFVSTFEFWVVVLSAAGIQFNARTQP